MFHDLPSKFYGTLLYFFLTSNLGYLNNKKHGIEKWYYPDGKLYCEIPYSNNKLDGIKKEYYPNEQLKEEIPYIDGEIHGICKWYDKDGTVEEAFYVYNHLIKKS